MYWGSLAALLTMLLFLLGFAYRRPSSLRSAVAAAPFTFSALAAAIASFRQPIEPAPLPLAFGLSALAAEAFLATSGARQLTVAAPYLGIAGRCALCLAVIAYVAGFDRLTRLAPSDYASFEISYGPASVAVWSLALALTVVWSIWLWRRRAYAVALLVLSAWLVLRTSLLLPSYLDLTPWFGAAFVGDLLRTAMRDREGAVSRYLRDGIAQIPLYLQVVAFTALVLGYATF